VLSSDMFSFGYIYILCIEHCILNIDKALLGLSHLHSGTLLTTASSQFNYLWLHNDTISS
jgi:hypothetical protein